MPGSLVRSDGSLGGVVEQRVAAAVALNHAGVLEKILMSGDNPRVDYDEPGAMRDAALASGVAPRGRVHRLRGLHYLADDALGRRDLRSEHSGRRDSVRRRSSLRSREVPLFQSRATDARRGPRRRRVEARMRSASPSDFHRPMEPHRGRSTRGPSPAPAVPAQARQRRPGAAVRDAATTRSPQRAVKTPRCAMPSSWARSVPQWETPVTASVSSTNQGRITAGGLCRRSTRTPIDSRTVDAGPTTADDARRTSSSLTVDRNHPRCNSSLWNTHPRGSDARTVAGPTLDLLVPR